MPTSINCQLFWKILNFYHMKSCFQIKKTTRIVLINNAGARGNMVALKYLRLINWMTDPMNNIIKVSSGEKNKVIPADSFRSPPPSWNLPVFFSIHTVSSNNGTAMRRA